SGCGTRASAKTFSTVTAGMMPSFDLRFLVASLTLLAHTVFRESTISAPSPVTRSRSSVTRAIRHARLDLVSTRRECGMFEYGVNDHCRCAVRFANIGRYYLVARAVT